MNLVIFTPAINKSAIGRMAAIVAQDLLKQGHHITIVRTECDHLLATSTHDFGAQVISWKDNTSVASIISTSDSVIYHIGNNYEFHEGALHWLSCYTGVVCLHDFFLASLFFGWAQSRRQNAEVVLAAWYNETDAKKFFMYKDSESFINGTCDTTPMTEWVCSQASGVITHSKWGCDRVLASCSGPVIVVPLAYDAPGYEPRDKRRTKGSTVLLTVGHINPNKRVESVIKAIGRSAVLKEKITYRLVGAIEAHTERVIADLSEEAGVRIEIWGEVDAKRLAEALNQSDVISCLRWPTLEAASASAIEGMLYGKPIVITDTGFYADLPNTCTIKIDHSNEVEALRAALEDLVINDEKISEMGDLAQRWASNTFSGSNYAVQTTRMIDLIAQTQPVRAAIGSLCSTLQKWSSRGKVELDGPTLAKLRIFESSGTDS